MTRPDHSGMPLLCDWHLDDGIPPLAALETRVLRIPLLGEGKDDHLEALPAWRFLSDDERVRGLRFVRARDRRRFVICRGSLRIVLGRLLNASFESLVFRPGPGGKPELASPVDHTGRSLLRFNVTHSHDLALVAVSLGREIGVDLERIRGISESSRIVESYFTASEQAQFKAFQPAERDAAFLRGWTRKEAILKAKGVGLAGLATSFQTMFGTTALTEQFKPATPLPRIDTWSLWEAAPSDGYVAALAIHDG